MQRKMWNDNPFDPFDQDEFTPRWICFGKGGGPAPAPAPTESSSTVNQTNLPDYAEPFFTRLLERTEEESNQPYTPFGNTRVAPFAPETLQSFNQIRDIGTSGVPGQIGEASNIASAVGNYQPASPFYTPSAIDQMPGGGSMTEAYMNPYVNQVLDRGQRRAMERYDEQQVSRDASFAQRGSFSNSRRDVASEAARRDLNEQLLDVEAKGLANAFDSAQQMFTSDAQRKMQAQIESERAAQSAGQMRLGAADQLAGYGAQQQQAGLQQADALGRIGALREERGQTGLDVGYTDFVNQRDYPRQQLNFYSGILRGVPVSPQSEITRYETPPSPLSQALGLGLGGLGLYQQFSNG